MLVEGRTVKSPGAGRGFLLSLDGITIYNLWKVVIANCENESYNPLKGPSIPAFTYRDGCLLTCRSRPRTTWGQWLADGLLRVIYVRNKCGKCVQGGCNSYESIEITAVVWSDQ